LAYLGTQYAITTSAAKLTTILGSSRDIYPSYLSIRNKTGNTTVVYIGPSTVTNAPTNARESAVAGERWVYEPGVAGALSTGEIYLVGSVAAEPVFITVIE
jgi:hypothetical protein